MVVKDNLDVIMTKLEKVLHTKTVFGDPMEIAGITIVPVMNVSFGFGAGGGEGRQKEQSGAGGGGGGGARLSVVAIIVIKGEEVSVMPLGKPGSIERLLESLPEMISKLKGDGKDATPGSTSDKGDEQTSNSS